MQIDPVLIQVQSRMLSSGISPVDAARQIGVGLVALERHLAGAYVRSDSLAKYRLWLNGQSKQAVPPSTDGQAIQRLAARPISPLMDFNWPALVPERPRHVVDLFCGCGGMSLGFERFREQGVFKVSMALDIEEAMVRVFNDNHPTQGELPVARRSDITDFLNESEVRGFYLDHLARSTGDGALLERLGHLGIGGMDSLRKTLQALDAGFLQDLATLRGDAVYVAALKQLGSDVLGQTSVVGFHNATKLPATGVAFPRFGPLIWHADGVVDEGVQQLSLDIEDRITRACRASARRLWDSELAKLMERAEGSGRGQLASAADRIGRFRVFMETPAMRKVKSLWLNWRASREAVRRSFFENAEVEGSLRELYRDGRRVSVLLGGPPCQGFSRIGRGKIRSLKEQGVHVHEDEDSVDSRNQLMHQYVLFVSALAPDIFLFENVRHFQAVVKSEGIEFDAADILAEAIKEVSHDGLGYAVARRIAIASEHAVPQGRERFVMAGVRGDCSGPLNGIDAATWCLTLQHREEVPLQVALEGLPSPSFNAKDSAAAVPTAQSSRAAPLRASDTAGDVYRNWAFRGDVVDAHIARPPRVDDQEFFKLMGPGKRWMDYRCDGAPTLERMASVLSGLKAMLEDSPQLAKRFGFNPNEVAGLCKALDGSLSLRLLLEAIPAQPGELQHHLLTENYLQKRDGAHGDWLSRMDPAQPSKTIVSHMAKDTYAFVHPFVPRTLSVREAARIQSFPDDYRFGSVGLVDGFRVVGNAVPPLLSLQFAERVAQVLALVETARVDRRAPRQLPMAS